MLLSMMVLATIFFAVQVFVGDGINWGIGALVFSANMATFWVKYVKSHLRHEFVMAIAYTVVVSACSIGHIYDLSVFN